LDGIPEAKRLFADMLDVSPENVIVCGNSSLAIMYGRIKSAFVHGIGGNKPWHGQSIKFLCPVPGYDRHFSICEHFGIEMVAIPMDENGPDMNKIETLVEYDSSIKGIWCVPLYSNPSGTVYSDEVVKRFANLKPKANDFRIFWDNAYCVHHLTDNPRKILNILHECEKAGNPDLVYEFSSTSKITFSGSGIGVFASSKNNVAEMKSALSIETIGYDKLNQLRHVKFLKSLDGIKAHMEKHREILAPKFKLVLDTLERELSGIATWTKPDGGYFVSFNAPKGTAKEIVRLCKEAGLVLTGAGAAYPYGYDKNDSNIRIAPTYPGLEELENAMELFCTCVKLVSG
jgi:DNA-binding transcriptional MocR family regulator